MSTRFLLLAAPLGLAVALACGGTQTDHSDLLDEGVHIEHGTPELDPAPPPVEDVPLVQHVTDALPLTSISRDLWPCGATTEDGDIIQYTYGDVDECTLDPVLFIVGCPITVLHIWTSEGEPYKAEEDTLTYDGNRLVNRTSRAAPMGTNSALRDRVTPEGKTYDFAYDGDRMSAVSTTRPGENTAYKQVDIGYPSTTQLIIDPTGSPVVFRRTEDGRLLGQDASFGGRQMVWEDNGRASGIVYHANGEVSGRLTFTDTCPPDIAFPDPG